MSKKLQWPPPKPDPTETIYNNAENYQAISMDAFDRWYAEHIESLGPAVEVVGSDDECGCVFGESDTPGPQDTHRALLIGIQPLKEEETAEDLLLELLDGRFYQNQEYVVSEEIVEKARKFFEKKGHKV